MGGELDADTSRMRARTTSSGHSLLARAIVLAIGITVAVAGWSASGAPAASSNVIITADVVSSTTLVNGCLGDPARTFGTVLPGTNARTATGAGVCRISFGSTSSAQLRIGQADGAGTAMGFGTTAPALLSPYVAPGRTLGVFGYDATVAMAAGKSGTAYRTTNGGASWQGIPIVPGGNHNDIEATPGDPNTWWIIGNNRSFHRTSNGITPDVGDIIFTDLGAPLSSSGWPGSIDLNELSVPSTGTLYVVGEDRWIGKYSIAGNTWTSFQHTTPGLGDLTSVDALSDTHVLAAAANGSVLHTTTGATSSAGWTTTAMPGSPGTLTDIAYASATRAYAVGLDGYLATWDGTTWTNRSDQLAMPRDLVGVDSIPGSPGSVLVLDDSGMIHRSDDAGLTWNSAPTGSGSRAGDIHAATVSDAYIVAAERSLSSSHDGAASWSTQGPTSAEDLTAITASPVDGRRILAVGASAFRSTDAGGGWTNAPTGRAFAMHDARLVDDTHGWAVGDAASILHTSDLGATWTTQTPPSGVTVSLLGVTAHDRLHAVAVGMDGTIIATANSGSHWTTRASGTTRHLTGVDSREDLVIAVGEGGTVLRSTDAGATWAAVPGGSLPDASADLLDVAVIDDRIAYAATRHDVWRSTDAGATWATASTLPTLRVRAMAAAGRTVVVVGDDDQAAYSTDDGTTFTTVLGGTGSMHLNSVAMVDSHTAVIGGADQRRLRMDVDASPDVLVPDWTATTNDWDSGSFFGVCLQDAAGSAVADWTEDASGQCDALDTDPWQALPSVATQAAHTPAGSSGNVDLVWGFRTDAAQRRGTYEAGIAFEAIAP
jgi:photosystem II stability/assembly factor-like uncharacterized protein